MKKVYVIAFMTLFILFACKESKSDSFEPEIAEDIKEDFAIMRFDTFPPEIDGCSCYFSRTKDELQDGLYVYTDNFSDKAFMKISGEMVSFALDNTTNPDDESSVQVWRNDKFELTLHLSETEKIDQTQQYKGTLMLKNKDDVLKKENIFGECGC